MRFSPTRLQGAFLVEPEPHEDSRGFFARTFCAREFGEHSLVNSFVQCSTSLNLKKGTLRGLHYQIPPAAEAKLVRCTAGAIWDVIVDLRSNSPTRGQYLGVELTARNRRSLYIPALFAHGFQSLEDNAEVFYQISEFYVPDTARGIRFNDPNLAIPWPLPVAAISEKDANWPGLPQSLWPRNLAVPAAP